MARVVTLFTGQWADLPLADLAEKAAGWGYEGLELACWGDHFEVDKALADDNYCKEKRALLDKHGLKVFAISTHLVGQAVCDNIDARHQSILPPDIWGDGDPAGVQKRAAQGVIDAAKAAKKLGVDVVNGFTGSSIWHYLYSFPPVTADMIDAGYADFAKRFTPILDAFKKEGVKFGLEVHPTEIAFDIASAFGSRIFHTHMKDVWWGHGDGTVGVFGGHTEFADPRRYWDFRSLGHGDIDFEEIIVALNDVGYQGPLSVEWEDSRMDREHGAKEACEFVKSVDFKPSQVAFDSAFDKESR